MVSDGGATRDRTGDRGFADDWNRPTCSVDGSSSSEVGESENAPERTGTGPDGAQSEPPFPVRSSWDVLKDGRVARAGRRPRGGKGWRRPPNRTGRQRLSREQALEIRQRVAAGESRHALATAFAVSEDTVGSIAAGHTWRRA